MRTWERNDPDRYRPIAAPLDRCAEILGVDLATIRRVAANVEPYVRADGIKVWSLMQLERQLRPDPGASGVAWGPVVHRGCSRAPSHLAETRMKPRDVEP